MNLFVALRVFLISLLVILQACGGGGSGGNSTSSGNNSSSNLTPKVVSGSSMENKAVSDLPVTLTQLPKIPDLNVILSTFPEIGAMSSMSTSLAVADFQRNGSYSAFVIASDRTSSAKAFFVGYDTSTSSWTNLSTSLFHQSSDRNTCLLPQQAAVADLNNDGRPDVYVACATTGSGPVAQALYLSRADGKYEKAPDSTWPSSLNASSVALADFTNDGCLDVITTNNGSLVIYEGHCVGGGYTLTDDTNSRSPTNLPGSILNVFLVPNADNESQYDLLVAADPTSQSKPIMWFSNNGSGYFDNTSYREYSIRWGGSSNRYDFVVSGSYGYLYITQSTGPASQTFVKLAKIIRPRPTSGLSVVYYTPTNSITPVGDWPSYLRVRNNNLEPYDAACSTTIQADDSTRCGKRYPLADFPSLSLP
ncbi:MAG: VCBS repeat-containing protein [Betaproteobacteria bacterium]|jgi:hypothetical protein|nr:VCBS repeat-containing protein [Betaproteobacteria bacterium]